MGLTRLTLRDLPTVDSQALEVLDDLPKLRKLYLHELASVGDSGLVHIASLKSLEVLDIWSVPQMTDATMDVICALPQLEGTDDPNHRRDRQMHRQAVEHAHAAIADLQRERRAVTAEGIKKLASKKWTKLDTKNAGTSDPSE